MQFNSYLFILCFLPLTVICYFISNKITLVLGKMVIVIASIIFYSTGNPNMIIYLGISIFINYFSALIIKELNVKKKVFIVFPVIINVGLLFYFKYLNFTITNVNLLFCEEFALKEVILPLGISFYTFQQIAYVVATARGDLHNNNLIDYLAYILYFPKLLMGPIVEPADFIVQINQENRKRINTNNIAIGIKLLSFGLVKKVLIADTFAKGVAWTYTNIEIATAMDCILLLLFYTFEIYFDFSGYSDMATGVSTMLNIDLPINFDSPYKALSIRDFWKRWHISLTKFFTKYIYIPLGGDRKGKLFVYINILIVFLISGLWHGANWTFILWGVMHGVLNCCDRLFDKIEEKVFEPMRWLCTFIMVSILWLLFSAESVTQWKNILQKVLFMQDTTISDGIINSFKIVESRFIYDLLGLTYLPYHVRGFNMWIFIFIASFICFIPNNNYRRKESINFGTVLLASFAFIWGILCLGTESTFVYFGF